MNNKNTGVLLLSPNNQVNNELNYAFIGKTHIEQYKSKNQEDFSRVVVGLGQQRRVNPKAN